MGKVQSIFNIRGKLGDYVFYSLQGKQVARRITAKKKVPKSQLAPILVQQNTEFGKASSANKFLRTALAEECARLNDRYLYQHLSHLMMKLKSFDSAPSGFRTVAGGLATKEGPHFLCAFNFHQKSGNFPKILRAQKRGGDLYIDVFSTGKATASITELQIDFEKGKFRRQVHALPATDQQGFVVLKKQFRSKKGFTDLVFIHGERFLQGCVVNPMQQ